MTWERTLFSKMARPAGPRIHGPLAAAGNPPHGHPGRAQQERPRTWRPSLRRGGRGSGWTLGVGRSPPITQTLLQRTPSMGPPGFLPCFALTRVGGVEAAAAPALGPAAEVTLPVAGRCYPSGLGMGNAASGSITWILKSEVTYLGVFHIRAASSPVRRPFQALRRVGPDAFSEGVVAWPPHHSRRLESRSMPRKCCQVR